MKKRKEDGFHSDIRYDAKGVGNLDNIRAKASTLLD